MHADMNATFPMLHDPCPCRAAPVDKCGARIVVLTLTILMEVDNIEFRRDYDKFNFDSNDSLSIINGWSSIKRDEVKLLLFVCLVMKATTILVR